MTNILTQSRRADAGEAPARKFSRPSTLYTVFLLLLNLAALSVAVVDAKGIALLILTLMYTAHLRLQLTQREEQRRTNDLLEELLENGSPLSHLGK